MPTVKLRLSHISAASPKNKATVDIRLCPRLVQILVNRSEYTVRRGVKSVLWLLPPSKLLWTNALLASPSLIHKTGSTERTGGETSNDRGDMRKNLVRSFTLEVCFLRYARGLIHTDPQTYRQRNRQTDRQTHYKTLLLYWGRVINTDENRLTGKIQ